MRPIAEPAAIIVLCAAAACAGGCGPERPESGQPGDGPRDITRRLEMEIDPPRAGGLKVENLAGSFEVRPGSGEKVLIRATVHAGSEELAGKLRLEQVPGEGEGPVLVRVAYPLDEHASYRYGESSRTGSLWLDLVGAGRWVQGIDYAGRNVRVSSGRGAALYADVEVFLPSRGLTASFDNKVGGLHGQGVTGTLSFTTTMWNLQLDSVSGDITARTRSGDLTLKSLEGTVTCTTASGDVRVDGLRGGSLSCTAASGDVTASGVSGDLLEITTASGDVSLQDAVATRVRISTASGNISSRLGGMAEFQAGSASGSILFTSESLGLEVLEADTVGGSIRVELSEDLLFHARVSAPGGRLESGFDDAEPVMEEGRVVGYRRGEGGAELAFSTGHGDISLAPIQPRAGGGAP